MRSVISRSALSQSTGSSLYSARAECHQYQLVCGVWRQVLNNYSNVQVIVIEDVGLYFNNSPVEQWYVKGEWRNSKWRVQHLSDYIRMVSLKKEGGIRISI